MQGYCEVLKVVKGSVTRIMLLGWIFLWLTLFQCCDPHCSIARAVPFDFNESNLRFWPQFVMGQTGQKITLGKFTANQGFH